jgi:hypothetical protein
MFNLGLCVMRPNYAETIQKPAPFLMLKHPPSDRNNKRFSMLSMALVKQFDDGLANVANLTQIVRVKLLKTLTFLSISVVP